jgi:uncharacterized protein (TIGR00251 family)
MSQSQARINVQVSPNARHNEVLGFDNDSVKVKIAAPPLQGKANKELIKFLSQTLKVSRGSIAIERGLTSRNKVIAIVGLDRAEIVKRLGAGLHT